MSQPSERIQFSKLHGCGNNFIVLEDLKLRKLDWASFSKSLCRVERGVGADGVMIVQPAKDGADFSVLMYNSDGSEAQMCGNGIRCVCRFLVLKGLVEPDCSEIKFWVGSREIVCDLEDDGRKVTVNMGPALFDPQSIPVNLSRETVGNSLLLAGEKREVTLISMGNPHCVMFLQDHDKPNITEIGAAIEMDPLFPDRTNVEFARIESATKLTLSVWERGAGLTQACGTGACATVAAGVRLGLLNDRVTCSLPGGDLEIFWDQAQNIVYMTGPAQEVFDGILYGY